MSRCLVIRKHRKSTKYLTLQTPLTLPSTSPFSLVFFYEYNCPFSQTLALAGITDITHKADVHDQCA